MIQRLFLPGLSEVAPFTADEIPGALRLHLNEGLPHNPDFLREYIDHAAKIMAEESPLNLYPAVDPVELRTAYGRFLGVPPENVEITSGSSEAIFLLALATFRPGRKVAYPEPSYYLYGKCTKLYQAEPVVYRVPLPYDREAMREQIFRAAVRESDVVVICNPNNPTGTAIDPAWIEEMAAQCPGLVIVDEAYIEYASLEGIDSVAPRVVDHENLVVLRTMSKAWSIAGLRVAAVAASRPVIESLCRLRTYRMSSLSQRLAAYLLNHHLDYMWARVRRSRDLVRDLEQALGELPGVRVHPTVTNFVFCEHPEGPRLVRELRRQHRILVRDMGGGAIRASVVSAAANDRLVAAIGQLVNA